jgi:signal transduction histidine kinase
MTRSVSRIGRRVKARLFDVLIVLGAIGGVLEVTLTRGGQDSPRGPLWVLVLTVLVATLPLLARRRFRFAAPAGVVIGLGVLSFVEGTVVPYAFVVFLSVVTCAFLFGMNEERRQGLAGLALIIAVGAVVTRNDPEGATSDLVFTSIVFGAAWLGGLALGVRLEEAAEAKLRAERAEREREEQARAAVAEERQRIARELHDVVAHSVSVMTVQAGGVRRLLREDQQRERAALEQIEQTGRQALAEMRRLLGILRQPTDEPARAPQPGMASLGTLIQQMREAGLPIDYRIRGEPRPLPPGIDVSAYRIVQEALTNALKYAGPARAEVMVSYGREVLQLEVVNDGAVDQDGDRDAGHGLVGMQERVALYGGKLEIGPLGDRGFAVRALLPVREQP